eukprot:1409996-Pyramimonas_sp.AAC.1
MLGLVSRTGPMLGPLAVTRCTARPTTVRISLLGSYGRRLFEFHSSGHMADDCSDFHSLGHMAEARVADGG